jgi:hypothetical protein
MWPQLPHHSGAIEGRAAPRGVIDAEMLLCVTARREVQDGKSLRQMLEFFGVARMGEDQSSIASTIAGARACPSRSHGLPQSLRLAALWNAGA